MAVALVLPGVSGSQMLLMLGLYGKTMDAIASFDLAYILPHGRGHSAGSDPDPQAAGDAAVGIPKPTTLIILGFIAGSVVYVFPEVPSARLVSADRPLAFLAGFGGILFLSRFERGWPGAAI